MEYNPIFQNLRKIFQNVLRIIMEQDDRTAFHIPINTLYDLLSADVFPAEAVSMRRDGKNIAFSLYRIKALQSSLHSAFLKIYMLSGRSFTAIHSISTLHPFGIAATSTQLRAG